MTTFENALYQWNSDTIKKYVTLLGGKSTITRKNDRINFICRHMLYKGNLLAVWKQLDEIAKRAVSTAYHNAGEFDADAFVAQYGQLPPRPQRGAARRSYYYTEPILFDLFIFDGQIPTDLQLLLADLVLPAEHFKLVGKKQLPAQEKRNSRHTTITQADTEIVGRMDLLIFLQMVEQKQVRWSRSTHLLTAASIRKVMANLISGDFLDEPETVSGRHVIRPFGLDIFTQEAGLVTRTGKLTPAGRKYLQTQDSDLFLDAFEKWSEQGKFDELKRITHLHGLKSRGTRLSAPASRRSKIIEALSWCPTDTWIDILDFYRAFIIWQFDFDVEKTQWSNLYAGPYKQYGDMHGGDYWRIVKGLYINAIIMEYLGTIGAVDLAFDVTGESGLSSSSHYIDEPLSLYDGLFYFRINNWGAYLLGQADEYVPTAPPQKELFSIDSDLTVHLLAELMPNDQMLLEATAVPINAQTYRLDTVTLLTTVDSGQDFDYLYAFFEANHRGKMPQTVSDWFSRLKQNIGAVVEKDTCILIHIQQQELLHRIKKDKTLARLCQPLDDTKLLVLTKNKNKFRKRLMELGYLLT